MGGGNCVGGLSLSLPSSLMTGKDGAGASTLGRGPARLAKSVSVAVYLGVMYIRSRRAIATRCLPGLGT